MKSQTVKVSYEFWIGYPGWRTMFKKDLTRRQAANIKLIVDEIQKMDQKWKPVWITVSPDLPALPY